METINLWTDTAWYLELLWNVCLFALPTLAGLAVLTASGGAVIKIARTSWRMTRPFVDEANDPLILFLAAKTGHDPAQLAAWLIARGDEVIALLPETERAKKWSEGVPQ